MNHSQVAETAPQFRRIQKLLVVGLVALAALAWLTKSLPHYYFVAQDQPVIIVLIALLVLGVLVRHPKTVVQPPRIKLTRGRVLAGAAILALLLWAGTYLLFDNYPLSRDEQMVVFDMQVFRSGHLAAPVPVEWRAYVEALTPAFLLPIPGNAAWISSYMPVNAMVRALFDWIGDPALANPVLAAIGAVATYDCARRLFPGRVGAQSVALLIYATSAQVLAAAMTPYAMTGHLALNMLWLSFYLRGTRLAHAAAIAIGFLAIGLHQIIFHPLFVLPFIDELRRRGKWRTAVVYVVCYAGFALFWISYQPFVASSVGARVQSGAIAGPGGFIAERVLPLLIRREPLTFQLMAANLLRFISWQNLALLPLVALALPAVRRDDGEARALLYGVMLTTAAMAFLLPYQALGWGYRYLHGLIGNCALLAAYGWRDSSDRQEVRAFVASGTMFTVLLTIPFLLWQAASFVKPFARVNRMIGAINADMVIVEIQDFTVDEVRNRPDLSNRPIRLAENKLTPGDIRILCARGTVAFVDARQTQAVGMNFGMTATSPHMQSLRAAARDPLCRVSQTNR